MNRIVSKLLNSLRGRGLGQAGFVVVPYRDKRIDHYSKKEGRGKYKRPLAISRSKLR